PSLRSFHCSALPDIYTLSLHDALPICNHGRVFDAGARERRAVPAGALETAPGLNALHWPRWTRTTIPRSKVWCPAVGRGASDVRSEEHTSELQSRFDLVCRLLLEKKKK